MRSLVPGVRGGDAGGLVHSHPVLDRLVLLTPSVPLCLPVTKCISVSILGKMSRNFLNVKMQFSDNFAVLRDDWGRVGQLDVVEQDLEKDVGHTNQLVVVLGPGVNKYSSAKWNDHGSKKSYFEQKKN